MAIQPKRRLCKIESASIEDAQGSGDGAYDLLDVVGDPDIIGNEIAKSLKEIQLCGGQGKNGECLADGEELFLGVTIRLCEPESMAEHKMQAERGAETFSVIIPEKDGPIEQFESEQAARDFARHEVGASCGCVIVKGDVIGVVERVESQPPSRGRSALDLLDDIVRDYSNTSAADWIDADTYSALGGMPLDSKCGKDCQRQLEGAQTVVDNIKAMVPEGESYDEHVDKIANNLITEAVNRCMVLING